MRDTDLENVVEHGSGVFVERLGLARLEDDEAGPGVSDVGAVPPDEGVLLAGHLQAQGRPADPRLSYRDRGNVFNLSPLSSLFSSLVLFSIHDDSILITPEEL